MRYRTTWLFSLSVVAQLCRGEAGAKDKYLVLVRGEWPGMEALAPAAAAGLRLRARAEPVIILERVESGVPHEYVSRSEVSEEWEMEIDGWGAQGFRVLPHTIGSWLGTASVALERAPEDSRPRDYRVLETGRKKTLEKELLEAAAQGYRVIGLTTPGQNVLLLEAQAPSADRQTSPSSYRLLSNLESAKLSQQAADGYRLLSCSDVEQLCVFEKTSVRLAEDSYLRLETMKVSTLETELSEAGRRGYRLHPGALGASETSVTWFIYAVMEKTASPSEFAYRILSFPHYPSLGSILKGQGNRLRASEIHEDVALAAREGFQVVAMTSGDKSDPGLDRPQVWLYVIVERSTPK